MKAIVVGEGGELAYREVPEPPVRPGEVMVDVHATALNRADLSQRAGHYPPPRGESEILGLEMAGIVREVPDGVHGVHAGDRVCALLPGGGYAERVAVPAGMLMPVPEGWSFAQAAALPEAAFTAFLNLFLEAGLRAGERVLIHGGASGVGTAAIQQAVLAGASVYTTAGSEEKVAACRDLGAELAIPYRQRDFAEAIREHAGVGADDGCVDVILDMVGEAYFERNLELLRVGGRMVFIATLSGRKATFDIRRLMARRATLKGSTLRSRPPGEKVRIREAFEERFGQALAEGRLDPVIDSVVPIEQAAEAHERMRANRNIGKVVLLVREGAERSA
ncbi:MAG: NAD(P)H-quinone oxidoreductase [Deinococcales bacterium]